jgi:type I restriction enzyme S subunit
MNTPKIRFKGFTDDWEQRKLGDVFKEYSEKHHEELPALTIVQGGGTIFREESDRSLQYDKSNLSGYKMVKKDDFIVHLRSFEGGLEKANSDGIISPAYHTMHGDNVDSRFYYPYFRSYDFINRKLVAHVYGIRDGRSIDIDGMKSIEIPYTSYEEQKTIGDYLDSLDHLITLHQRKCDETKQLKKFMLQKMFPKNGEKNPKIRFEGFTDDWEQRKFSELVTIERGGSPRPIDRFITKEENGLNWIKIGDAPEQGNYITKTEEKIKPEGLSKTREVHPGDLILSNSMSFGRPYILAIDGCIHDGWLAIRDTEKRFDLKFLCTLLGTDNMLSQYKAMAAGSTVNNLNKELVGATTVSYPVMDEQVKLGEFFDGIDHLITLHQRKCEKLKALKKFMLQNMFI